MLIANLCKHSQVVIPRKGYLSFGTKDIVVTLHMK
ncbi:Uncharacterised protein [Bacillus freudenreichii]|nr:Uncharacterised protein [Bacillus freudenreichii]